MKNPKYCERCGCYIPDLWDSCPSCGNHNDPVLNDIKSGRGIAPFGNLHPAEIPVELHQFDYHKERDRIIRFAKGIFKGNNADVSEIKSVSEYNALDVATYILYTAHDKYRYDLKYGMTNYRLNIILYYVQAEFLVWENVPCFSDKIIAKPFGPIVQKVFDRYCIHGCSTIYAPITYNESIRPEDRKLIDGIVHACVKYPYLDLVGAIGIQKPYQDAMKTESKIITNESLKSFFGED